MAVINLNNISIYASASKGTSPSLKIQKDSNILYCPLFEGLSKDPFMYGKDLVVSREKLILTNAAGTVYSTIKLEEILDTAPKLTLYYKATYNQQSRQESRTRVVGGSYTYGGYSTKYETYYVTTYRRLTTSNLKLGAIKSTNTKLSTIITSATCNGKNILNTYAAIASSNWTDWYQSAPAYPSFTESHAITVKYEVRLGSLVVKNGSVNVGISVPINSSTERNTTLTMGL